MLKHQNQKMINKIIVIISNFLNTLKIDKFKHEESISILDKIDQKNDNSLWGRSKKQYQAQQKLQNQFVVTVLNFLAFFLLPFILLILSFWALKNVSKRNQSIKFDLAFSSINSLNIEPLSSKYKIISEHGMYLNFNDFNYILKAWFYFPPYFTLKFILRVLQYSYAAHKIGASAIITSYEYSFLSSALTDYCEKNSMKHINVMHGEKLFFIRDSFFKFHKTYVWDEYYIDIFKKLKADVSQFEICLPLDFKKLISEMDNKSFQKPIIKYYLDGSETREQIEKIKRAIQVKEDYVTIFRAHPIYSNIKALKSLNINIEDPNINIYQSILESKYIIAKYSTVLFQAYLAKKDIVIDNISQPKLYEFLINVEYIMLKKEHIKLSNF